MLNAINVGHFDVVLSLHLQRQEELHAFRKTVHLAPEL
ncbi:hypothetical protein PHMEG_00040465 [Phytophthora megakarya]|uniref:Uncharacterized protein n=1 Tax=Phytophthora megakarya TaxID=4795 RepID=A0A225UDI6_9STRA|nr:hypothetical protein PHMEG_00040465 [Phytophthora megakarya]